MYNTDDIVGDYGCRFVEYTGWHVQPCGKKVHLAKFKCGFCGNFFVAPATEVKRNKTRSCGCYRKISHLKSHAIDLTGKKIYMLTAIKRLDERSKDNQYYWLCKCDCGNYTKVKTHDFQKTQSCGCLNFHSGGEEKVKELLLDHNIYFEPQYSFEDCVSDKNSPLRFDFYIPSLNTCIEIDGRQHREPVSRFGGEKSFVTLVRNDQIKNEYCLNNNIRLIRIPYDRHININIEKELIKYGIIK